ncbi:ROK family protein [Fusobacterium perfoetens]|uniref:ROK family protein n=1 Tax=Fusobacterium perfoetens TaxID=852 RepID=UPI0015A3A509|nr:ROK family protein [Fusobacterium perfoetens]MCF2624683.1 ROK family protein [Fusobacterium perfoetens]
MNNATNNRNIANLLRYINIHQGGTKLELAENLNLSPASLTKISKKLISENILYEEERIKNNRKRTDLLINYNKFKFIGIDLRPDTTTIVFTNTNLEILHAFSRENSNQIKNSKDLFHDIFTRIQTFIKENDVKENEILGMGITINLSEFHNKYYDYSFLEELNYEKLTEFAKEYFSFPVIIDTFIRALALYQTFCEPSIKNFFFMKYNTLIDGSIIVNNQLVNPFMDFNKKLGLNHVIIEPDSDVFCDTCKRKGCIETMISSSSIIKQLKDKYREYPEIIKNYDTHGFDYLVERAEKGEVEECLILKKIANYTALIILNIDAIFSLDNFVVSGKLFKSPIFKNYLMISLQSYQLTEIKENFIISHIEEKKEFLASAYLPVNYIFYNYNF